MKNPLLSKNIILIAHRALNALKYICISRNGFKAADDDLNKPVSFKTTMPEKKISFNQFSENIANYHQQKKMERLRID